MDPFSKSHVNIYHYFSTFLEREKSSSSPCGSGVSREERGVFRGFEGCCSIKLQNCFRGKLKQTYFFY